MRFEATFESLHTYTVPKWFRDAKFGIWSHWGPQSVPMFGDWYARNMYIQGQPQYEYHLRHYGHPSKFGYKDICALWKAEKFDPDALIAKYHKAGARYLMTQAVHHDHFFNYDSKINRMNSVNGPPQGYPGPVEGRGGQIRYVFRTERASGCFLLLVAGEQRMR